MRKKLLAITFILSASLLVFALVPINASAATLSITNITNTTTTKAGTVTGTISSGGTDVTLGVFSVAEGITGNIYSVDQVTSDASGNFTFSYYLVPDAPVGSQYQLVIGGTDVTAYATSAPFTYIDDSGATPSPNGTITGKITAAANNQTILVSVFNGSALVTSGNPASDGTFTLNNIPAGAYSIKFTKGGHISLTCTTVTVSANLTTTIPVKTLKPGDVNGDDMVNVSDLSAVSASFNKVTGVIGFNSKADINEDGIVNISDLSAVSANFNKTATIDTTPYSGA